MNLMDEPSKQMDLFAPKALPRPRHSSRPKPSRFRYVLDYSKRMPGTNNPLVDADAYFEFMTKIRKRT